MRPPGPRLSLGDAQSGAGGAGEPCPARWGLPRSADPAELGCSHEAHCCDLEGASITTPPLLSLKAAQSTCVKGCGRSCLWHGSAAPRVGPVSPEAVPRGVQLLGRCPGLPWAHGHPADLCKKGFKVRKGPWTPAWLDSCPEECRPVTGSRRWPAKCREAAPRNLPDGRGKKRTGFFECCLMGRE